MIVDRKIEYNQYAEYREDEYDCELVLQIPVIQTTTDSDR